MISTSNYICGTHFGIILSKLPFYSYSAPQIMLVDPTLKQIQENCIAENNLGSISKTGHLSSLTSLFKNDQRPKLHMWNTLWNNFEQIAILLLFSPLCPSFKYSIFTLNLSLTALFKNDQRPKLHWRIPLCS